MGSRQERGVVTTCAGGSYDHSRVLLSRRKLTRVTLINPGFTDEETEPGEGKEMARG